MTGAGLGSVAERGACAACPVRGRVTGRRGRLAWLPILAVLLWLCRAYPLAAQADRVATGAAGLAAGTVAGVWTTVSLYVAKARTGSYIFSADDLIRLRPETLPIATFPIAGAVVGATSPSTLADVAIWGGLGFAAGAGLGLLTGHLVRGTSEARWAGGIIGSGVGMLAGVVFGALRSDGGEAPAQMAISIPLPIGGVP